MNKYYTLITGAGNGLGKEMAIECARRGISVLLVSLSGRNLKKFCQSLRDTFQVEADFFECDLTETGSIEKVVDWVRGSYQVNCLINNAGLGGTYPFEESEPEELELIIQLNIKVMVILTRLMIPLLKIHSKAYILNVSSMAALSPVPFKTVYAASKTFVVSFSKGLWEELKNTPVRVSVLLPGPMLTNPEISQRTMRQGFIAVAGILSPGETSRIALDALFKGKAFILPGFRNKLNSLLVRIVPAALRIYILSRIMRNEILPRQI